MNPCVYLDTLTFLLGKMQGWSVGVMWQAFGQFSCQISNSWKSFIPDCVCLFWTPSLSHCPVSFYTSTTLFRLKQLYKDSWNQVALVFQLCSPFSKLLSLFCVDFRTSLSISTKRSAEILIGITLNLQINFGQTHIMKTIESMYEKRMPLLLIQVFNFSQQCSVMFSVQVFHIFCQIYP